MGRGQTCDGGIFHKVTTGKISGQRTESREKF